MTPGRAATVRRLALVCMAYALVFSAVGIAEVLSPSIGEHYLGDERILDPLHWRINCVLLALPGFFAGQLGYFLAGAAGRGRFARIVIALAALGATMSMAGQLLTAVTLRSNDLFGYGMPLGQWIATLLLGVAALLAKQVTLWKRIFPLWVAVAPQVFFPLYIFVFGWPAFAALATQGVNWLIFGWLVWQESRQARPASAVSGSMIRAGSASPAWNETAAR